MPDVNSPPTGRVAADGSPYPDRQGPRFEREVRAMFSHIARRYDWFDHVASLGNDFVWRPRALWALDRFRRAAPPRRILDVGCGTGDLTRLAAVRYHGAELVGIDFTRAMLAVAHSRATPPHESRRISYAEGSALALPFRSGTFDVAMSAFVVRNLPRLPDAFRELRRVLAPGGTLLTLEITEPTSPAVRRTFLRYFETVVPALGALVGSEGPYRYLPESLRSLPPRDELLAMFRTAGFGRVEAVPQSMGIVTTFLAAAA